MLPRVYLAVALCVATLLCFVTAPFAAPDEENQSKRAIQLSHGGVRAVMGDGEAGGPIDRNAVQEMDGFDTIRMAWEKRGEDFHDRPWGTMTAAEQKPLDGVRWARAGVLSGFGNTAVYPPALYGAAMAGWRLGEAADLTIVGSLRLARWLDAVGAVVLGWLALRVGSAIRWPLFAVLLVPSTLFLEASCSQDALLLGVAALLAAVLSRVLAAGGWSAWELAGMAGLIGLMALARPPYLALGVLLFVPAGRLAGRGAGRWIWPALLLLGVVGVVLAWHRAVAPLGIETADEADVAGQIGFLRGHPVAGVEAVLLGTWEAGVDFGRRGLYVLGWNDLLAPWPVRLAEGGCLLAVLAGTVRARMGSASLLIGLGCLGAVLGISLAEYLIWTPPGLGTVYGVQPRYWLPLLPLLAVMAGERLRAGRAGWMAVGAAGGAVAVAISVPWMAARMFYGGGLVEVLRLNVR